MPLCAQRVLKPVHIFLQQNKPSEALAEVKRLVADPKAMTLPKLYDYGVEANTRLYDKYNEKMYLKQASDTAAFFRTTYDIFAYALKCDSLEQAAATEGKKLNFRKKNSPLLRLYYPNLLVGTHYFYRHRDYATANQCARMGHLVPTTDLWGADSLTTATQNYHSNASLAILSYYRLGQADRIDPYLPAALSDSSRLREAVLRVASTAAAAKGDSALQLQYLQTGLHDYPASRYFFDQTTDYYLARGDYGTVRRLATEMAATDSLNTHFLATLTYAHLCLGDNRKAIATGKHLLSLDTANVEANYYVGMAYCNEAAKIELPTNINHKRYKTLLEQRRSLYKSARTYLEAYRRQQPADSAHWAPLLYRVYLELNEGRKFDEIERILAQPAS